MPLPPLELALPWSGHVHWHALEPFPKVLARRVADHGQWVIGVAGDDAAAVPPGHLALGVFGHLGYAAKDRFEALTSRHVPSDSFPEEAWWPARHVIVLGQGRAMLRTTGPGRQEGEALLHKLLSKPQAIPAFPQAEWTLHTPRHRYLRQVERLLEHIQRGDIYEVNHCTRRTARLPDLDPWAAFAALLRHTDAPFAGLLRLNHRFALCASPERFLRLDGQRAITQPIKGTRPRAVDIATDRALAAELQADPKERSEHVMAVDVARNDLGRVAVPGSVHVEELCAVKQYATVHQLVSTVAAQLRPEVTPGELFRATFPMASMTGAPKIRAMQLIDENEDQARGLFSGTMGFFLPDGTADLNVVIRTLTWHAANGEASLLTGGAITAASKPEAEWEECQVKARSVLQALGHA
jgi:para-aminobenzoate synthetase component 1